MLRLNRTFNLVKLNFIQQKKYSINSEIECNLKSHLKETNKISENLFLSLVKSIEKNKSCDSETALTLIKSCGINFIDQFPIKRQYLLNYLFDQLLRDLNVKYDQKHYDFYMSNTLFNDSSFDPFKLNNQMNSENILNNMSINHSYIKQFCQMDQLKLALLFLRNLLESQNLNSVDFTKLKQDNFLSSNNYYENFIDQMKKLKLENDQQNDFTELFSPILDYFFKQNDPKKSLEIIEILNQINLKPSNSNYVSLISGHLHLSQYQDAQKTYDQVKQVLTLNDLVNLYLENSRNAQISSKSKNEFTEALIEKFPQDFNLNDRVLLVNLIMKLTNEKKFDEAFYLVKKFFSNEVNKKSQEVINIPEYYMKSLVEYEESWSGIKKYTNFDLDSKKYLRTLLQFALLKQNTDLSLKLIKELNSSGERIKASFFYPLMVKEANELEQVLCKNNGKKSFKIEKQLNFKRLESLSKMIRFDYDVEFGIYELNVLLGLLRSDQQNELKSFLKYSDIVKVFDRNRIFNTLILFNASANKILNFRLDYLRKNQDKSNFNLEIEQVLEDFNELNTLINNLNISLFEDSILNKLNRYLNSLYRINMVFEDSNRVEESIVFQTLKKISDRLKFDQSDALNNIINDFLEYSLKTACKDSEIQQIKALFENNFQKNKQTKTYKYKINEEFSGYSETLEELNNLLVELENKNKNIYPTLRRILIKICNQTTGEIANPIVEVNKLLEKLPENELTPLVCQDLMYFFNRQTFDSEKSKYYFRKLIEKANKEQFDVDPKKILDFCQMLVRNKEETKHLIEVFSKLKWSQPHDSEEEVRNLLEFLNGSIFYDSTSEEFRDLVEKIFESNFSSRNPILASLVIIKFIEMYKLNDAFEYFKLNLVTHKTSVSEILLLKSFLSKYENKLLKGTKLEELLQYFSKFYANSLAYNFLFFAHMLNGDFYSCNIIFDKNLNKQIDLNVLKRLVNQINSSKIYRKHTRNLVKILNFIPISQNTSLKYEIKAVLNKLN